jgi:hypothetical protein
MHDVRLNVLVYAKRSVWMSCRGLTYLTVDVDLKKRSPQQK